MDEAVSQRVYNRDSYPDPVLMWYHKDIKGYYFEGNTIQGSGEVDDLNACIAFIFKILENKNVIIYQMSSSTHSGSSSDKSHLKLDVGSLFDEAGTDTDKGA